MASASVSCASAEIEPCEMAPVENRARMRSAGSTSSSGTAVSPGTNSSRSRIAVGGRACTIAAYLAYSSGRSGVLTARFNACAAPISSSAT